MVSGFAYASVSKGMIIGSSLSSLLVSMLQVKYYAHFQLVPHLSVYHQYWRLAAHHIAFTNSSELFLATFLLYIASVRVERTFGTHKFASFLLIVTALSTALLFATLLLLTSLPADSFIARFLPSELVRDGRVPGGPFAPLFAILFQYARIVPDRWTVRLGRYQVGDRAQIWVPAVLLFFSQPTISPLPCLLGLLASSLYRSDLLLSSQLKNYRIPHPFFRLLSHIFRPFIGSTRTPTRPTRVEPPRRRPRAEREAAAAERQAAMGTALERRGGLFDIAARLARRRAVRMGTVPQDAPGDPMNLQQALENIQRGGNQRGAAQVPIAPSPGMGLREYFTQMAGTGPAESMNETNVRALQSIFPDVPHEGIVRALQLSDGSQTRAVERLLQDETLRAQPDTRRGG